MVRGACAAVVGLPSDQVSKPFTTCPCHVPAAARSRRSPASPAPRVLVPPPWPSSRSVLPVGHSRLLPPVVCTAAVSSGTDALESCELFFNIFYCV